MLCIVYKRETRKFLPCRGRGRHDTGIQQVGLPTRVTVSIWIQDQKLSYSARSLTSTRLFREAKQANVWSVGQGYTFALDLQISALLRNLNV